MQGKRAPVENHRDHLELAVANIALEVVCALGRALDAGRLISSGYRSGERPELRGFLAVERRELDGWAADLFVAA